MRWTLLLLAPWPSPPSLPPPTRSRWSSSVLRVQVDFSKLEEALANHPDFTGPGSTNLTIYYPWSAKNSSLRTWPAMYRASQASADFTLNVPLPVGLPYGTYIVVAEKNLNLAGGTDVDQVVRKATWFTVGNGIADYSTWYQVSLTAWLPDWA